MAGPEVVVASIMRRDGATGVQTHANTLIRYLASQGRSGSIRTPFDSSSALLRPVFGMRLALAPVHGGAGVWWYRHWHEHYLEGTLHRYLATGAATDRVIYAQCPVAAAAALKARSTEPVVMVVHFNVSQAQEWADKGEIRREGPLYNSIEGFEEEVLPRLDGIVYVSEFMRSEIQERIPAVTRVPSRVIPNFIDVRPMAPAEITGDLITVGALEPRKNQAFLLEVLAAAAARGHRLSLTIVGEGPLRRTLVRRAEQLGVGRQVAFVGHHPDPRTLMRHHRVYCHASRMESFGITLIEAMSVGLPVLAAPVGAIPEVVRPGETGEFWALSDPVAAAELLIRTLATAGATDRLGREGRTRVVSDFSLEVAGHRLLGFLDSMSGR